MHGVLTTIYEQQLRACRYLSAVASGERLIYTKTAVLVAAVAIRALPDLWNNVVVEVIGLHVEGARGGQLDETAARVGALTFCRVFVQVFTRHCSPDRLILSLVMHALYICIYDLDYYPEVLVARTLHGAAPCPSKTAGSL